MLGANEMINFTVGPVQMSPESRELGSDQVPYFRTPEFSAVMLENERLFLKAINAPEGSRVVFLTASGTGGMEAAIINCLTPQDTAIVVDGGSFGHRFVQICELHDVGVNRIALNPGQALTESRLLDVDVNGCTAFVVNLGETSTGVLYDLPMIGEFCKRNNLFLIVDAVSAFLTEEIDFDACGVDVLITGSQKALAVPPGISVVALSPRAVDVVNGTECKSFYFDLKDALKNGVRGQTPFTPAVSVLLQINQRLRQIDEMGVGAEIQRVWALAEDLRNRVSDLPFELFAETPAHAVSAFYLKDYSATKLFAAMKDEYGIWICPNGGALAEDVFRIGHIGCLSIEDNERLSDALHRYFDLLNKEV